MTAEEIEDVRCAAVPLCWMVASLLVKHGVAKQHAWVIAREFANGLPTDVEALIADVEGRPSYTRQPPS